MKRPNSKRKDQESIDLNHDGFVERQHEVDHYPEQARQYFDSFRALQLKNEAAGYYTLHDAAMRLAQAHGKSAEWWRSRMCADWLQGRLKMRDGAAWMTIDPPVRPTDPKRLSEWIAYAKFGAGPSDMHRLLEPDHYPPPDSLDVVSAADLDEWLKPMGYSFSGHLSPDGSRRGTLTVWTPTRKAEAREYRDKHGLKKTAEHYKVSQATISKHIPAGKKKAASHWDALAKK